MTHEQTARAIKIEYIEGSGFIDWEATLVNIAAALAAERERCARVAEAEMSKGGVYRIAIIRDVAAAIRKGDGV